MRRSKIHRGELPRSQIHRSGEESYEEARYPHIPTGSPGWQSLYFAHAAYSAFVYLLTTYPKGRTMANKEQNRKGKSNKPKLTVKEKQAKKLAARPK